MNIKQLARGKLKRPVTGHKGNFGRVFILAGSRGMTGAAHLAGMGALRSGAGLVTLGIPDAVYLVIAKRESELMVRPFPSTKMGTLAFKARTEIKNFCSGQDVLALGPGLSQNISTQKLIRATLRETALPLIIDADGINALKGNWEVLHFCRNRAVLTPHPGEFVRVFGGSLSDAGPLRRQRAFEAAQKSGTVIVLKGHRTVVASPRGEIYVNTTGNAGMATAGSGDVLTGVIAAFVGQGCSLFEAACLGAYVHGLAGDLAAKHVGPVGLIAGDLIRLLPEAIKRILAGSM